MAEILRAGPLSGRCEDEPAAGGHEPVEEWFGRSLLALRRDRFAERVHTALRYWRSKGFPYPRLSQSVIVEEVARLQRAERGRRGAALVDNLSTVGLRVANAFHPQMWHVVSQRHLRSPIDLFRDDDHLLRILERAPRLWPNRRCWNAQCIRSALRISAAGRVANFRPVIARRLIQALCPEGGNVLDFSAGYGGRLLGALSVPVHYVGIDPHRLQALGLRRMIEVLGPHMPGSAKILRGCAEEMMPALPGVSVDLVFSSPPYFNLERYEANRTQSAVRYSAYRDWVDFFLGAVIRQSHRVLRPGGRLALNVANIRGYRIADDAERLLRALFRKVQVLDMPMGRVPSHLDDYAWQRSEPVYICLK